jgi:two-component system sensor histidine kinase PilS (NtrC family)
MDQALGRPLKGKAPWVVFRIFCGYRLFIALLSLSLPGIWEASLSHFESRAFHDMLVLYAVLLCLGFAPPFFWKKRFYVQLTAHILLDVCVLHVFMVLLGGIKSGLGLLMLVSVAGASLMATGRLALLFAAMASIFLLTTQSFLLYNQPSADVSASLMEASILGMGFFLAAGLACAIGLRLSRSEQEASRRKVERDNQIAISQRVMEGIADGLIVAAPSGEVLESNSKAREFLGDPLSPGTPLFPINAELAEGHKAWLAERPGGEARRRLDFNHGNRAFCAHFSETQSSDGASLILVEDKEQLLRTAQQMKLAALGRLTASVAHEIRNPLAAIRNANELLAESLQEGTDARLCAIIHDNAERIARTIEDILSLGRTRAEPSSRIELAPWLANFRREFLEVRLADPERFVLEAPEGTTISFDPEQLRRILGNLVDNALRHASPNPGALLIRVDTKGAGEALRVQVHVIDDGPGIAPEIAQQVFEPFFTTNARGTGLGLFIARELAEANGARLMLAPGAGGHFVLSAKP